MLRIDPRHLLSIWRVQSNIFALILLKEKQKKQRKAAGNESPGEKRPGRKWHFWGEQMTEAPSYLVLWKCRMRPCCEPDMRVCARVCVCLSSVNSAQGPSDAPARGKRGVRRRRDPRRASDLRQLAAIFRQESSQNRLNVEMNPPLVKVCALIFAPALQLCISAEINDIINGCHHW